MPKRPTRFIPGDGPWTQYRSRGRVHEVDFHHGRRTHDLEYKEAMAQVAHDTLKALRYAQENGYEYVLFTHGQSTSRPGATTSRSVVRGIMRSTQATPFILRSKSIQHNSVFVAAIRPISVEPG